MSVEKRQLRESGSDAFPILEDPPAGLQSVAQNHALKACRIPSIGGWNLLGMAGSRWHIIWSPAIPWLQVAGVIVGVAYSIKTLYHCWLDHPAQRRSAVMASFPLGSFLWIAAAGMIYFFAG